MPRKAAQSFPCVTLGYAPWWSVQLFLPDLEKGYYRGTRFDRGGVFGKIMFKGKTFSEQWLEECDPLRHDNVRGPSEEYSAHGFDEAAPGETFVKIGVGRLIRPDEAPYDHFRLYEVADPGTWEVRADRHEATFRHILKDVYDYTKTVRLTGLGQMQILHELRNTGTGRLDGEMYNHHFFTLGRHYTGPGRSILFPYVIDGKWRTVYDAVVQEPGQSSIYIKRKLKPGESLFMSGIRSVSAEGASPYEIIMKEMDFDAQAVRITSPTPFAHATFWSNHRVACIEPFVPYNLAPGEVFSLELNYTFIPDYSSWLRELKASRK